MVALASGLGQEMSSGPSACRCATHTRWPCGEDADVAAAHLAAQMRIRPRRRSARCCSLACCSRWARTEWCGSCCRGYPTRRLRVAPYLAAFAVIGILYGAVASYGQGDLKRVIAFSSVGHMGFVLLGISTLSVVGVNAALFGNIAHGLITGLLFFVVGGIKDRTGTTSFAHLPRGLYATAPRLGFLLGFAAVASLGMPGLAGFWGEFLALVGAYHPLDSAERLFYRVLLGPQRHRNGDGRGLLPARTASSRSRRGPDGSGSPTSHLASGWHGRRSRS